MAIVSKESSPNPKPTQGICAIPYSAIIQPANVVPTVTPKLPKDVARLFANSNACGAADIMYADALKKHGAYKNPQTAITPIVAQVLVPESCNAKGNSNVPVRKKAVVAAILLASILPAIQLDMIPATPNSTIM